MRLADALVAMSLLDDRPAPGWSEVRTHLTDAGQPDPDRLILDGIRDGDAFARLNDDNEWTLRVRWPAAREVLLRYAARRLEDAGVSLDNFTDYQGDDDWLVVPMAIELAALDLGKPLPARPEVYRRLLRG
jgi:hypothetical protein